MAVNLSPSLATGLGAAPPDKAHLRAWLEAIVTAINSDLDPRATPIYPSRAAAVAAAPSLPSSLTHIAVREGTALVIRSRTAFADDPLFDTGARWGVVQRQDVAAEATARAAADQAEAVLRAEADAALRANGGKIFTSRADAVAFGQAALHPALGSIITVEGTALVMRAPYGKTDPLFGTDPTWGVAMPPIDVTALQQAVAAERGARSSLIEAAPGGGGLVIVDEAGFVGLRVSRSGRLSVFGQPINQN